MPLISPGISAGEIIDLAFSGAEMVPQTFIYFALYYGGVELLPVRSGFAFSQAARGLAAFQRRA